MFNKFKIVIHLKFKKQIAAFFLFFCTGIFGKNIFFNDFFKNSLFAEENEWIIGAVKFSTEENADSAVESAASSLPSSILEKLNTKLFRNGGAEDLIEKRIYDSQKERQSLYLQLVASIKKRDSYVTKNYNSRELSKKISEENKNTQEIKQKITQNLLDLENDLSELEKLKNTDSIQNEEDNLQSDSKLFSSMFKNMFTNEKFSFDESEVKFYKNDVSELFNLSEAALTSGYESSICEKETVNAKINTLITGRITAVDEYIFVTVELYNYPGGKKQGTFSDFGGINEIELIARSLAEQITPSISNSMPVYLNFNVSENCKDAGMFLDSRQYSQIPSQIIVDSGVHYLQFYADGFKTYGMSYYFSGNQNYQIDVNLEIESSSIIEVSLWKGAEGNLFFAGESFFVENSQDEISVAPVKVDGKAVLGQFTDNFGNTAFFYIPQKMVNSSRPLKLDLDTYSRSQYIDKRRKMMYAGYSALMVSLIPTFVFYGNSINYTNAYNNGATNIPVEKIQGIQTGFYISAGISCGAAVFWIYELIRYFIAADSILPENAKYND